VIKLDIFSSNGYRRDMHNRRTFLKHLSATSAASILVLEARPAEKPTSGESGMARRRYWLQVLEKIGRPVLESLSRRELRKAMPVETAGSADKLRKYTHLEAISRLLVGIAPWLEGEAAKDEQVLQRRFSALARECLDAATDPKSPDFMNFSEGQQPLVDTAFLAQAVLRAPRALGHARCAGEKTIGQRVGIFPCDTTYQ
jgi:hypothetical protein